VSFSLWIETEHVIDPITDFRNVIVSFEGGTEWALNVWTFDFFATARNEPELAASAELAHTYMRPPDLFVAISPAQLLNEHLATSSAKAS
jgi:hypothetical protein